MVEHEDVVILERHQRVGALDGGGDHCLAAGGGNSLGEHFGDARLVFKNQATESRRLFICFRF